MKLLADENVHALVVAGLLQHGLQIEWLAKTSPSDEDEVILARSDIDEWILLTYDRDFGELIFHHGMPAPAAVIYSRLERLKPDVVVERVVAVLSRQPLEGHLVVLTDEGDRYKSFTEASK